MSEIPNVQLQEITDEEASAHPSVIDYDLVADGREVGKATLDLNRQGQNIAIDWVHIHPAERRQGYGSAAAQELFKIAASYERAQEVHVVTASTYALRTFLSIPIENEWRRSFSLAAN